jgi:hypothetical protein
MVQQRGNVGDAVMDSVREAIVGDYPTVFLSQMPALARRTVSNMREKMVVWKRCNVQPAIVIIKSSYE